MHALARKREENKSFAVGHFALGYILSKLTAEGTKTRLNIPLALMLSVIPDADILFPFIEHRGPTHSLLTVAVIFLPLFVIWRKKALPYFVALIQHSLISDFIAGGRTQLLWPLTLQLYGIEVSIQSLANITLEWTLFITSMIILLKSGDMRTLLQPHNSNLILFIPLATVLLPTFLAYPLNVPPALIIPHIILLVLFSASLLIDIKQIFNNNRVKRNDLNS